MTWHLWVVRTQRVCWRKQCRKYSAYKTVIHTLTAYLMHRGRPLSICSPAEIHIKAHCTWAQSAHFRKPNHAAQIHSSCTRGLYALCRKFMHLKCRFHLITLMHWFALSLWGTPQYLEQWVWGPNGPHIGSTPTVRKPLIAFNSLPKWAQTLLGLIPQSQLQTSNYPGCCVRTVTGLSHHCTSQETLWRFVISPLSGGTWAQSLQQGEVTEMPLWRLRSPLPSSLTAVTAVKDTGHKFTAAPLTV